MSAGRARWTIVADDLTGAADAAATYGPTHSSTVLLDAATTWPEVDILAVNTESRYLPQEEAAAAVRCAVSASVAAERRVFKKIDSLLRGNPGLETAAALSVLGSSAVALVAPAFPGTGRTTVHGVVHVDGRPNASGHFAGNITDALAVGGLDASVLPAGEASTAQELAATLDGLARRGVRAVILDAATEDDLGLISQAAELMMTPTLMVGSGGLASQLLPHEPKHPTLSRGTRVRHRALSVIGSYSPLARVQLEALKADGATHLMLDHERLDALPPGIIETVTSGDAVITPDPAQPVIKANATAVARSLANAALFALRECDVVVVSGGETARAILDGLGVGEMTVLGELEPGVVVSTLPGVDPLFITKAGAFGNAGSLVRAIHAVKTASPTADSNMNEMREK